MATFKDLEKKLQDNPSLLGELVVNPKTALQKAGIDLTNKEDIKRLEGFVRMAQSQIKVSAGLVGFNPGKVAWGIGAGCCNGKSLNKLDWVVNPPR
jgi:hypothetical protein